MTEIVQGQVSKVEEVENPTGLYKMPLGGGTRQFVLSMAFNDGSEGKRLVHSHDVNAIPKEGDIIRATEGRAHDDAKNPVFRLKGLYNAANMGDVDINTTQKSHCKYGEDITGVIVEHTTGKDAWDKDCPASKLRLDDGAG